MPATAGARQRSREDSNLRPDPATFAGDERHWQRNQLPPRWREGQGEASIGHHSGPQPDRACREPSDALDGSALDQHTLDAG